MGEGARSRLFPLTQQNLLKLMRCPLPQGGEGALTTAVALGYAKQKLFTASLCKKLKAKIGHDVAALVLDHVAALGAFERVLGVLIAERYGSLVVGLGGV